MTVGQYLPSSEEVLDQRSYHLHPQLHLPAWLLKGGRGHHTCPAVELLLLLGKRDNQELQGSSRTSHSACRPWGSSGAPVQAVPVKHPWGKLGSQGVYSLKTKMHGGEAI